MFLHTVFRLLVNGYWPKDSPPTLSTTPTWATSTPRIWRPPTSHRPSTVPSSRLLRKNCSACRNAGSSNSEQASHVYERENEDVSKYKRHFENLTDWNNPIKKTFPNSLSSQEIVFPLLLKCDQLTDWKLLSCEFAFRHILFSYVSFIDK